MKEKGIRCPHCGDIDGQFIIESRPGVDTVRRRRQCHCNFRFTTYEHSEERRILDGGEAAVLSLSQVLEEIDELRHRVQGQINIIQGGA